MTRTFAITWDYRCPYGRIAHDHVVTGLRAGADWDVTFLPFCLGQSHVEPGMPDVWDAPETDSGILALQVAVAVRDQQPHAFLDLHHALTEADSLATGPSAWGPWKEGLVNELASRVGHVLGGGEVSQVA
ncbi:MAG: hypothetical protein ACO38D_11060, partial [Ilumatobacteraceae bacterium]